MLSEQKDVKQVFHHVRGFDVDQLAETLLRVMTMNFVMRRARILKKKVFNHNEKQKEAITFLTNTLSREGETGFKNPVELDACME